MNEKRNGALWLAVWEFVLPYLTTWIDRLVRKVIQK